MTKISLGNGQQKEEESKTQYQSIAVETEPLIIDAEEEREESTADIVCGYFTYFLFFFLLNLLFTSSPTNPHHPRQVQLNMTNGRYGIVMAGNEIVEIVNGSSAYLQGDLKTGDEIQSVNGFDVAHLRSFDYIIELMHTRADEVDLVVVMKYEEPLVDWIRARFYFPVLCVLFLVACGEFGRRYASKSPPRRVVTLTKVDGSYGFHHKGCEITQVAEGGPGDLQGHLVVGEKIEAVNGTNVRHGFYSQDVSHLIKAKEKDVTLTVRGKDL